MKMVRVFPFLRKVVWKTLYEQISRYYPNKSWIFMNRGYAPVTERERLVELSESDEPYRYFIQLYDHAINGINLQDKDVLETGCGRGGGVYFMNRYLGPGTIVGLDYSKQAIKFCINNYTGKGMSFVYGDAEALPFDSGSFHVLVDVESSHCYISKNRFYKEAARVLKKGGYFCYADLCETGRYDMLRGQVYHSGMSVLKEENITTQVITALEEDSARRLSFFKQTLPEKVNNYHFREFAGEKGSTLYEKFKKGEMMYFCFLLCK